MENRKSEWLAPRQTEHGEEWHAYTLQDLILSESTAVIAKVISPERLDERDEHDKTALYYALIHGRGETARWLLDQGANLIAATGANHDNAMRFLIQGGSAEALYACIDYGATIPSHIGRVPVVYHSVAQKCPQAFVQKLVELGKRLEPYEQESVLSCGIRVQADPELIEWLLTADLPKLRLLKKTDNTLAELIRSDYATATKIELVKATIEQRNTPLDEGSKPPLALAIEQKQAEVAKVLIEAGASYRSHINDLAHLLDAADLQALIKGVSDTAPVVLELMDFNALQKLIAERPDLTKTPLMLDIVSHGQLAPNEKSLLLEQAFAAGAQVNQAREGVTALNHLCSRLNQNDSPALIKQLLGYNAQVEVGDRSALLTALKSANLIAIEAILEHGANANFVTEEGWGFANALIHDVVKRFDELTALNILSLALKHGYDINTKTLFSDDETITHIDAISFFAIHKAPKLVKYLLDESIHINPDSHLVYYAIRGLSQLDVQLAAIATNPNYCYPEFSSSAGLKDDAYAIELAIFFKRHLLVDELLARYPSMKTQCKVRPLALDMIDQGFSDATIATVLARDPDINHRYPMGSGNKVNSFMTYAGLLGRRIAKQEYGHRSRYLQLLKTALDLGLDPNYGESFNDNEVGGLGIFAVCANPNKVDVELFDLLITYGANPLASTGSFNESAVHSITQRLPWMTDAGILSHLKYFQRKTGINLTERNARDTDLLMAACMSCRPMTAQWLIEQGADIHVQGAFSNSPLLHLAMNTYPHKDPADRAKTIEVLLNSGLSPETRDTNGATALMTGSYYGAYQAVTTLLKHGANVHTQTASNATAINFVIEGHQSYDHNLESQFEHVKSRIIQLLAEYGADLNNQPIDEPAALTLCIKNNRPQLFEVMLKLGADPNVPSFDGITPLFYAVLQGNPFFVQRLLADTNINLQAKAPNLDTALSFALQRTNKDQGLDIARRLLELGTPLSIDDKGQTLIHDACILGHESFLTLLLEWINQHPTQVPEGYAHRLSDSHYGAATYIVLTNQNISMAVRERMLSTLIQYGIDLDTPDQHGYTALMHCVGVENEALARTLWRLGADAHRVTKRGENLAHLVAQQFAESSELLNVWLTFLQDTKVDLNPYSALDCPLLIALKGMPFTDEFSNSPQPQYPDDEHLVRQWIKAGAAPELAMEQAQIQARLYLVKYLEQLDQANLSQHYHSGKLLH